MSSEPPSYSSLQHHESSSSSVSRTASTTSKSTGIQLAHDADFLIRTYIPAPLNEEAPPYRSDDIPSILPLCIPRISVNANPLSAFARGYNPALGTVGITQDMFLSFIDGLNLAIVASPPLRIVNIAGQIIGFVPFHWAMIASIAMSTASQVGMRVLSKTLTDRYLRAANLNLFKPRGLSVRLCTTPAVLHLIGPESTGGETSKTKQTINKIGRGVGTVFLKLPIPIISPIAARIIHAVSDKPPPIAPSGYPGDPVNSPVLMRRLALLEHTFPGTTLPVYTQNLPPPAKPEGVMQLMNSWGVKFDEWRENKAEKKNEDRRRAWAQIQAAGVARGEYPYGPGRQRRVPSPNPLPMPIPMLNGAAGVSDGGNGSYMDYRTARREARAERKAFRRMEKNQRKGMRKGHLSGMSKVERRTANADLLEHWATNNVLWVVVMPAEKDEVINDIQIAEDPANEERIDEETWKMAMEFEKDQMEDEIESEDEWEDELAKEEGQQAYISPPESS